MTKYLLCCRNIQEITSGMSKDSNIILGGKGKHAAMASQENRCLPGSGNTSKKCNSCFLVLRLCSFGQFRIT